MSLRASGQGLVCRGLGRWGQAGGALGEHESAVDDSPAIGKGQKRTGPDRKEASIWENIDKSQMLLSGTGGKSPLECWVRMGSMFPSEESWGPSQVHSLGTVQ